MALFRDLLNKADADKVRAAHLRRNPNAKGPHRHHEKHDASSPLVVQGAPAAVRAHHNKVRRDKPTA